MARATTRAPREAQGRQEGWASVASGPTPRPNFSRGVPASPPQAGGPVREPGGDQGSELAHGGDLPDDPR
eukprot:4715978-Pleurochrysis_carterae.AAC.1